MSKIYLERFINKGLLEDIIVIGGDLILKDEVNANIKGYIKIKVEKLIRYYGFIEELLKNPNVPNLL